MGKLNLLGPLGNTFVIDENVDHHIIIGGGIGIAPFPFLIKNFKMIKNFLFCLELEIKMKLMIMD